MRLPDHLYDPHLLPSCGYHTQEEEHAVTRAFFQNELNIPDENIQDILYETPYADGMLGMYELSELFLLVDPRGNISNTCVLGEDYFGLEGTHVLLGDQHVAYDDLSFFQKFVLVREQFSEINTNLFLKNIDKHHVDKDTPSESLYGVIPFFDYYDEA